MEIEILTAQVKEQVLTITTSHTFVADTQNIYTASFAFDAEWEGFAKAVIFRSENCIRFALLDSSNKCVLPADVIEAERLEIGIQGNKDGQVITTKRADKVRIFESGGSISMVPAPFEQSEFDKLMDELAQVRKIAEKSIADAEQSHTDAEQVAADKNEVANSRAVVLQKAAEVASNTTVAQSAAATATAMQQTQNLYNQLQPMNADVSSKAPSIVNEATGSAITLEDSAELPLQSLTLYGKSTQDGTPTPETPVEIKSVENPRVRLLSQNLAWLLLKPPYTVTSQGVTLTMVDDGAYTLEGTALSNFIIRLNQLKNTSELTISDALFIEQQGKSYIMKDCKIAYIVPDNNNLRSDVNNMDTQNMHTPLYNRYMIGIQANIQSGRTYTPDRVYRPEVYLVGQESSDFVLGTEQSVTFPYTLRGIPVSSGGNYTDADGQQWICDTIEVNADGTGKLIQRCVEVVATNENPVSIYNYTLSQTGITGRGFSILNILPEAMSMRTGFCNRGKVEINFIYTLDCLWLGGFNTTRAYIPNSSFYDDELEDKGLANFKAFLAENPLKIVTYVNTPTEIELTTEEIQAFQALHTNKPYTTIFNNAQTEQTIEYVADTKLYIDNKFAELQNTILSTGGNV